MEYTICTIRKRQKLAAYSGCIFCEKPFVPWNQDHRRQEGRSPTDFCTTGLDGMSGTSGFEENIQPEYAPFLRFAITCLLVFVDDFCPVFSCRNVNVAHEKRYFVFFVQAVPEHFGKGFHVVGDFYFFRLA